MMTLTLNLPWMTCYSSMLLTSNQTLHRTANRWREWTTLTKSWTGAARGSCSYAVLCLKRFKSRAIASWAISRLRAQQSEQEEKWQKERSFIFTQYRALDCHPFGSQFPFKFAILSRECRRQPWTGINDAAMHIDND